MWQLIFFFCCVSNNAASAVILKCETSDGVVYFTGGSCKSTDISSVLPCEGKELSAPEITKIEQQLRHSRNTLHKKKIQQLKQKHIAEKRQIREQKQNLRNKAKCETLLRQIAEINQHYKEGYTVQQGNRFAKKLAKYKSERQRYCKHE